MGRQEIRKQKRLEEWLKSLSNDKIMLLENIINSRVEKVLYSANELIETSVAAAISDLQDLSEREIEDILILANSYMKDSKEFLKKYGEDWIMELKKVEKQIKVRIAELLKAKTVKSKGIKILKKEFEEIPAKDLSNFWMQVKEELNINVTVNSLEPEVKKEVEVKETEKIKIEEPEVIIKKEVPKEKKAKSHLKLLKATIQGEYGTYEKEGSAVKVGTMVFKSENDLEKYKKIELAQFDEEIKREIDELIKRKNEEKEKFMKQLGEILDVISMVV